MVVGRPVRVRVRFRVRVRVCVRVCVRVRVRVSGDVGLVVAVTHATGAGALSKGRRRENAT